MRTFDDALLRLRDRGFIAQKATGDKYVPYTVLFTFAWDAPFMDLVHLRDEHDATASRVRSDNGSSLLKVFQDNSDEDPFEGEEWWKGEFVTVVEKLLALRPPSDPGTQGRLALTPNGLWVPVGLTG